MKTNLCTQMSYLCSEINICGPKSIAYEDTTQNMWYVCSKGQMKCVAIFSGIGNIHKTHNKDSCHSINNQVKH